MNCEECGTPTEVETTFNDGATIHRKRKCPNRDCGWYCVSQEKFVDDYYDICSLRRRVQKERLERAQSV